MIRQSMVKKVVGGHSVSAMIVEWSGFDLNPESGVQNGRAHPMGSAVAGFDMGGWC